MARASAPLAAATVALVVLGALAGCSFGGAQRVGGERGGKVRTLKLLDSLPAQEAYPYAREVARLSGGRLRIRVVTDARGGPDFDVATIRDVKAGRADLAIASARPWEKFGVPSLRALGAPFLVDSYPLQQRVLASAVVPTMLQQLRRTGLEGIGILPGPIRRPFGRAGALLVPHDFAGRTIGTQQSSVADATVRALGARPKRLPRDVGADAARLDGLEIQIGVIQSNRLDVDGSHLSRNVNLWPRPLVVFARASTFDRLTGDQQRILRTAARNVVAQVTAVDRGAEEEAAADVCRQGHTTFDEATPVQLQELRRAVEPVISGLERDPQTRKVIEAIARVKDALAAPASEIPTCTRSTAGPGGGKRTTVDGAWVMDTDRRGAAPDYLDENWGHWVFVFTQGRFAITQENKSSCTWGYGTYAVKGRRMSWMFTDGGGIAPNNAMNRPGEYFVFDFSAYHDTLQLAPVRGEISPLNFRAQPWRRLSGSPTTRYFSKRCPPPAFALTG